MVYNAQSTCGDDRKHDPTNDARGFVRSEPCRKVIDQSKRDKGTQQPDQQDRDSLGGNHSADESSEFRELMSYRCWKFPGAGIAHGVQL